MTNNKINRRKFLQIVAGTAGVSALACCGLTALGARRPQVSMASSSCGDTSGIGRKVLVTYGSWCGSTGEVAETIGDILCQAGATVDVLPVEEVADLAMYQAAVIGSAVRIGHWKRDAVTFVTENQATLRRMPVAYFTCCTTMREDTEATRAEVRTFMQPVLDVYEPEQIGMFGGVIDSSRLSFLERTMMNVMGEQDVDTRDWDAIHAWADGLASEII